MDQPNGHQEPTAGAHEAASTELTGTGAQEDEPDPYQKHKGGLPNQGPIIEPQGAGSPLSQQEKEVIWLEGYEAARK
eukprot:11035593-Heterocapsa_arctica.AAC.1